jgi:lysophospholipase L1-like esterase
MKIVQYNRNELEDSMLKRTIGIFSLYALLITIAVSGTAIGTESKLPTPNQLIRNLMAGKPQHIVTYGTSLTDGAAWVDLLSSELEKRYPGLTTVTNSGKVAMWSQWGVENLSDRVLSKEPDALFIEFSINDAYLPYKTSVNVCRINLKYMIDRVAADYPDCEIILMVMNPPTGIHLERRPEIEQYNQVYRDIARECGLLLIDHYPNWMKLLRENKATFDEYVPDGIHPSPVGCSEIILPDILEALGLR